MLWAFGVTARVDWRVPPVVTPPLCIMTSLYYSTPVSACIVSINTCHAPLFTVWLQLRAAFSPNLLVTSITRCVFYRFLFVSFWLRVRQFCRLCRHTKWRLDVDSVLRRLRILLSTVHTEFCLVSHKMFSIKSELINV